MLIHDANDYAENIVIDDASWRHVSLCHFKGTGTMTVNLNLAREKEFRVDRRTAQELAYVFDHFARSQRPGVDMVDQFGRVHARRGHIERRPE